MFMFMFMLKFMFMFIYVYVFNVMNSWYVKLDGIHWFMKRPGVLMSPNRLNKKKYYNYELNEKEH